MPRLTHTLAFFLLVSVIGSNPARGQQTDAAQPSTAPRHTESSADLLAEPSRGIVAPDRVAREDWPAVRALLRQSPEAAKFVAAQRRLVDNWAARGRDRADLVGGWVHDYIDPRTGIPLAWKEDTPEPPAGTTPAEQRLKAAWVTNVRQRNIDYTLSAARIFRATGEPIYAEWAMRQLDFYADNYERWPLRTDDGRARMFRNGLSEATNAFPLLETARLLGEIASHDRQRKWAEQLFRPMAENLKTTSYPMSNIGLWHQAAVAAIAMRLHDESLIAQALDGPNGIRVVLAYGLTADFLWIEGTFAYNSYVIQCLAQLLLHASLEGYAQRFGPEWLAVRRLLLSPIDYRFDDGWLPRPSDATSPLRALDPATHRMLYRLVPSYWGAEQTRSQTSWEKLVDPPVKFSFGEPNLPAVATHNFPSVRMAVLRRGEWQAFVHYGQAVQSHAQEEALTFELYRGTTPITTDSGTVAYASPYHTRYFRRAAANNVPMIDGLGQSRWQPGAVEDFNHADSNLLAAQPEYSSKASVQRRYQVSETGFRMTTQVNLKGPASRPARIGEAFHTDCAVKPGDGLSPAGTEQLPNADAMTFWSVQDRFAALGTWSVTLKCRGGDFRLLVSTGGTQRVFLATAPTTPLPKRRTVIYYDTMATRATYQMEVKALP